MDPFGLDIVPERPGQPAKVSPVMQTLQKAASVDPSSLPSIPMPIQPLDQAPITPQTPNRLGIGPIKAEWADWRRRADEHAKTMFAYQPGDTLDDITWKMRGRRDFTQKLEALDGMISPDDVDAIALEVYGNVAPKQQPFGMFSPDAQQALTEAYTSMVGPKPVATARDVDPNQATTLGAYMLTRLLRGAATPADALQGASALLGSTQQRLDAQFQFNSQQDQLRRELALQRFKALSTRDQVSSEQRIAESRDARAAARQIQGADALAGRQEDADLRRAQREAFNFVLKAVNEGDPSRVPAVISAYESEYGPLPDAIRSLSPTIRQQLDQSKIQESQANVDRIIASTHNIAQDAIFKERSMNDRLRKIAADADQGERRVRELDLILDFLPKEQKAKVALWWSQVHENEADIDYKAKMAQAALERAHRAGSGQAGDLGKQLQQQRIGYQGLLDNATRRYVTVQTTIDKARNQLTDLAKLDASDSPEAQQLKQRIAEGERSLQQIDAEIRDGKNRVQSVLSQIDQWATQGQPGNQSPAWGGPGRDREGGR